MGGHRDRVSPPTREKPCRSPHVRSGPTSGGQDRRRRLRGLGLRCPPAAGCSRPRWFPTDWKSGQLGRELEPWRAVGVLGPWTPGRAESVGGRGQARDAACCHCRLISAALAASWGKSFWGGLLLGTPSPPGHLRRTSPPVPARVPLGARPPPPGRPRGAEPITSARAWPAACSRSRRGPSGEPRGGEPRPSPPPALRGKVTSREQPPHAEDPENRPCAFPLSPALNPLPRGISSRPFPVSSPARIEAPATPLFLTPFAEKTHATSLQPQTPRKERSLSGVGPRPGPARGFVETLPKVPTR